MIKDHTLLQKAPAASH